LSPEVQHPEHLTDIGRAFEWVHHNIHKYGGDSSKIILCGHSAGAHLAVQLVTHSEHQWLTELPAPAGVIGISGVYNIARLGKSPFGPALVEPVFGTDPAAWRAASPTYMCSAHSKICSMPTLLINAAEDFHLAEDSEELDMALAAYAQPSQSNAVLSLNRLAARMPVKLHCTQPRHSHGVLRVEIPRSNHMTIIGGVGQPSDDTTAVIKAFIQALA
jgi:acetyl esterase/lipase